MAMLGHGVRERSGGSCVMSEDGNAQSWREREREREREIKNVLEKLEN